MPIKFHNEANDHLWFSEDLVWSVIQRYSDDGLMLYKQCTHSYYDFTGFLFQSWDEIQEYIENHSLPV